MSPPNTVTFWSPGVKTSTQEYMKHSSARNTHPQQTLLYRVFPHPSTDCIPQAYWTFSDLLLWWSFIARFEKLGCFSPISDWVALHILNKSILSEMHVFQYFPQSVVCLFIFLRSVFSLNWIFPFIIGACLFLHKKYLSSSSSWKSMGLCLVFRPITN